MHSRMLTVAAVCTVAAGMLMGCKEQAKPEVESTAKESLPVSIPGVAQAPDAKVVTINGESLTRAQLDKELDMITASPQFAAMPPEQAKKIRQDMESRVIERFVSQKLLSAAADAAKVEATDAEVNEFIKEIRGTLPENVTLETIMEERGIPLDKLRSDVASDIKIRKLLEAKTESVPAASDEQVAAYYEANKEMFTLPESVHARHILIKTEPDGAETAKTAAKEKIEGIHKQLVEGTIAFEKAAEEFSDCPSSKRGGDLGMFTRGQMVPAFEEAAFNQETNAIGPIVETPFGFHIIQVIEKQAAGERSLEEAKVDISEQLTMQEKQDAVQNYLKALREAADIRYGE